MNIELDTIKTIDSIAEAEAAGEHHLSKLAFTCLISQHAEWMLHDIRRIANLILEQADEMKKREEEVKGNG